MTQEALKLALEALEVATTPLAKDRQEVLRAITAIKEALAQTQEPVAVYGYCPECGAKGVMRERRPNGNDKCANGHTYPSSTSTPPQRKPLTDDLYNELLFAVGNKCPNETRHQTALRYILQAEKGDEKAAHGIKGDA